MFIRIRISLGASGSVWFVWVHSDAPRGRRVSWGSLRVTQMYVDAARTIAFRLGSLRRARRSQGSFEFASRANVGSRVHWNSRGFTWAHLAIVGFIQVRVGLLTHA